VQQVATAWMLTVDLLRDAANSGTMALLACRWRATWRRYRVKRIHRGSGADASLVGMVGWRTGEMQLHALHIRIAVLHWTHIRQGGGVVDHFSISVAR
jgi:hypothetical protein